LKYSDQTLALAETDLDRVNKVKKTEDGTQSENLRLEKEKPGSDSLLQTALQIEFSLPSSCYATMAIRELLKISSSVSPSILLCCIYLH
jgi:tRNA pseudouridine13 synthase